jgi:hypothetical protein
MTKKPTSSKKPAAKTPVKNRTKKPPAKKSVKKLTVRQGKFVDAVVKTGNATQAAIEAGYSPDSAREIGSQNLAKPDVAQRIEKRLEALKSWSANEGLGALVEYTRGNLSDFFNDDGSFIGMAKVRELGLGHLIKSIEFKRIAGRDDLPVEVVNFEMYDAMAAQSKLVSFVIKGHKLNAAEQRTEQFYEKMVAELSERFGVPREKVIEDIIARKPEAAQYLIKGGH